jgi:putative endonuclease
VNVPARDVGHCWEDFAAAYLKQAGLRILAQRYSCRLGEIDLIAADGSTLVFVEVRFRSDIGFGNAAATVTRAKQRRIMQTARHFIMCHSALAENPMRIDVIAIEGNARSPRQTTEVQWIRGAFDAD